MKIYLSPSTQEANLCKMGDTEEKHCNEIADLMEPLLKLNGIGFDRNTPDMTHISSTEQSNKRSYDLHYALHSDAFDSKQTHSTILYASETGRKYAEILAKHYRKIYPWEVKVKKSEERFTELYGTKAPAVIDEISFHDNPVTAAWIHNSPKLIARNKVQALCECFGKEYKETVDVAVDVKEFQRMTGLVVDGIIGPKTKAKAKEMLNVCNYIIDYKNPPKTIVERLGTTDVIRLNPMLLKAKLVDKSGKELAKTERNFINGNFFNYDPRKTIGWLISEGKVLNDRHEYKTWKGNPKGTLIVYRDGSVEVGWKWDSDIVKVLDKIWFCCQGFNLFPPQMTVKEGIVKEGFDYNTVGYATMRLSIGYNGKDIVIATRPDTTAERSVSTMYNLMCDGKAICLDSGGSVNMVCNGEGLTTTRVLTNIIYW